MNELSDLIRQKRELDEKIQTAKSKTQNVDNLLTLMRNYDWDIECRSLKIVMDAKNYVNSQNVFNKFYTGIKRKGYIVLEDDIILRNGHGPMWIELQDVCKSDTVKLIKFAKRKNLNVVTNNLKRMLEHYREQLKEHEKEFELYTKLINDVGK